MKDANEKRNLANAIIDQLFTAGETGQIQIIFMACYLSLKQLAPQELKETLEHLATAI